METEQDIGCLDGVPFDFTKEGHALINGFGRIGRTIMRIAKLRGHYDVVAVNDLASPEQLAYAFKYDSTHGIFPGEVSVTGDRMEINGDPFSVLSERDPAKLPWRELGVDYVI